MIHNNEVKQYIHKCLAASLYLLMFVFHQAHLPPPPFPPCSLQKPPQLNIEKC